jgi:IS30 family transposase
MTPEEKQIIVALSQQRYSSYKIAEMTGKNRRTISKFLRRRSGRDRKTELVRGDRIIQLPYASFGQKTKFRRNNRPI